MPLAPVTCLLRLDTDPEMRPQVMSYVIDEGLSRPFCITLHVLGVPPQPQADSRTKGPSAWLGHRCTVMISRPGGATRRFYAVVDACTQHGDPEYGDPTHPNGTCALTLVPPLALLAHEMGSESFADCTALDIIHLLLRRSLGPTVGLRMHPGTQTPKRRDVCVRLQESALDFMHRLLHDEALSYLLVQEGSDAQTLHIFDHPRALAQVLDAGQMALPLFAGGHITHESWHRFAVSQRLRGRAPEISITDVTQAPPAQHHAQAAETPWPFSQGGTSTYAMHGLHTDYDGARYGGDVALTRAQALAQSQATQAWGGTGGSSNALGLQPGLRVTRKIASTLPGSPDPEIEPAASWPAEGAFWVTDVVHTGSDPGENPYPPNSAGDHGEAAAYRNTVACVPEHVPFQATYSLPETKNHGVWSATVVGSGASPDPYVDGLGRVLVQFSGWSSAQTTWQVMPIWVRVAQAWAGMGIGTMFWPRPGMEVWVGFMGGSLDAPVVLGCAYNGGQKPPYAPQALATRSGWKSASLGPAGGANELMFEDAAGEEAITFKTCGEMHTSAGERMTIRADTTHKTTVGKGNYFEKMRQAINAVSGVVGSGDVPGLPPALQVRLDEGKRLMTRLMSDTDTFLETARKDGITEARMSAMPELKDIVKEHLFPYASVETRQIIRRGMRLANQLHKMKQRAAARIWPHDTQIYGDSRSQILGKAKLEVTDDYVANFGGDVRLKGEKSARVDCRSDLCVGTRGQLRFGAQGRFEASGRQGVAVQSAEAMELTAQTQLCAKARAVQLDARQEIMLRCGDISISLRNGHITITGAKVRIEGDHIALSAKKSLTLDSPKTRIH